MTSKELKEHFKNDRYVKASGIEILEVTKEYASCKAIIKDIHLNSHDMVQGGMLFTISDFAFALITNYLHPVTISQIGFISFINPCIDAEYIIATAKELSRTRHNCTGNVVVKDNNDKIICISQFNGFIK